LKRGIVRRRAADQALKRSGKHGVKLLAESRRLREHLRHLTHEILSAQEDERQKISRQLHDEIAQTLLGINVRLLTLKNAAQANAAGLKKEIASTQRLVKQSVLTINQFAHEFGLHHET
jgi:signal transduction histidine kinase